MIGYIQRKIYLYNVTFGLYMLDWWERYLFNTLVVVLMWFIFHNVSRSVMEFYKSSAFTEFFPHSIWKEHSTPIGASLNAWLLQAVPFYHVLFVERYSTGETLHNLSSL